MMEKAPGEPSIQEKVNEISIKEQKKVIEAFKTWIDQAKKKDYVSIHAYLSPSKDLSENIQKLRLQLLNCLKLATTAGYGPRFLHSTGQLHKGGPNSGLFIQLIDEPPHEVMIPETDYTFGELIQAQALGDYKALTQLGRRVLRINLKSEVMNNITSLIKIINQYKEE